MFLLQKFSSLEHVHGHSECATAVSAPLKMCANDFSPGRLVVLMFIIYTGSLCRSASALLRSITGVSVIQYVLPGAPVFSFLTTSEV